MYPRGLKVVNTIKITVILIKQKHYKIVVSATSHQWWKDITMKLYITSPSYVTLTAFHLN